MEPRDGFGKYLHDRFGNWGLCRRSARTAAKYDTCLSQKQYEAAWSEWARVFPEEAALEVHRGMAPAGPAARVRAVAESAVLQAYTNAIVGRVR